MKLASPTPPLLLLLAVALAAAACRPPVSRGTGPIGDAEPEPDGVLVMMTDRLEFLPRTVRVKAGEQVVWRNVSSIVHTVTAVPEKALDPAHVKLPQGAEAFDSGSIQPDGEYWRRFEVRGVYEYVCLPHEAAGMMGRVVVE